LHQLLPWWLSARAEMMVLSSVRNSNVNSDKELPAVTGSGA
jgi:hypothetical protein